MESSSQTSINAEVLKRLILRIYGLERDNFKTKRLRDVDVVEKIRKMIELEVNKDENL